MSEPTPVVYDQWVETKLWNHGSVCYPTTTGHSLEIEEGSVSLRFRFDLDDGGDPQQLVKGNYNLVCLHRVTDSTGQVWQARTRFRPSLFVYRMLDLNHLEQPLWQHNAEEWLQAIQERPLATGLYEVMDDRFYRRFWIDDALLEIQFKYQGLTIDIGQLDDSLVVVRLKGWFGTWNHVPIDHEGEVLVWEGGSIRPPEAEYDERKNPFQNYSGDSEEGLPGGWLVNLSPILYTMWHTEFLFQNDAAWHADYPVQTSLPRPIFFAPIPGERAEPQKNIQMVTTR